MASEKFQKKTYVLRQISRPAAIDCTNPSLRRRLSLHLEHHPEKARPHLMRGGKRLSEKIMLNNSLERNGDSKKRHPALAAQPHATALRRKERDRANIVVHHNVVVCSRTRRQHGCERDARRKGRRCPASLMLD
jgi:hypothetical protein